MKVKVEEEEVDTIEPPVMTIDDAMGAEEEYSEEGESDGDGDDDDDPCEGMTFEEEKEYYLNLAKERREREDSLAADGFISDDNVYLESASEVMGGPGSKKRTKGVTLTCTLVCGLTCMLCTEGVKRCVRAAVFPCVVVRDQLRRVQCNWRKNKKPPKRPFDDLFADQETVSSHAL